MAIDPRLKAYNDKALRHIRLSGTVVSVRKGTPEFEAWKRYFRDVVRVIPRWVPMLQKGDIATGSVPERWPWDFDAACKKICYDSQAQSQQNLNL